MMTDDRVAAMAKALGHPTRIAILKLLADRPCLCGDIVAELPIAQSTVSQHLKVLKESGWITGDVDGPRICYGLNREAVGELRFVLEQLLGQWESAPHGSTCSSCT
jgi:DNA-binding transcriptional ArsR family regulator